MKKLLSIILIFLLLLNLICINSYAVTEIKDNQFTFTDKLTNKEVTVKLPKEYTDYYNYFFIFKYSRSGSYYFYASKDYFTFDYDSSNSIIMCCDKYSTYIYTNRYIDGNVVDFTSCNRSGYTSSGIGLKKNEVDFIIFSSFDLVDSEGSLIHSSDMVNLPKILNTDEDLSTGKFDYVLINGNDFNSYNSPDINFVIRKIINKSFDGGEYESQEIVYNTVLNYRSKYINDLSQNSKYVYYIPQRDLGINFENEGKYIFSLEYDYKRRTYN